MTAAILLALALLFITCAAILTAAESAYLFLSRQEAEQLRGDATRGHLGRILDEPTSHTHAVRFWRVWFEMAAAVALAILYLDRLDNVWWAGLLATMTMAAIGFVLVGFSPRRYGRAHAARVVAATAPLVRFLRIVLGPVPGWLVAVGAYLTPNAPSDDQAFLTEEHFRDLVDRANEADVLDNAEADLIHSVFELGDTKVRSVMVPRTDMVTIERGTDLKTAMSLFLRSGCSRIPVIRDDADSIVGIIYLKDVAAKLHANPGDTRGVEEVARDVRYVPESKPVAELLGELQRESTHVAIVIDEYGGTAGLVTLEDLIEEIVGEIDDEYDVERTDVEDLGGGTWRVSARLSIDELAEIFDVEIEEDEVDTVGGLLAKTLERVPIVGSEVRIGDIMLRADTLEGRRNRLGTVLAWKTEKNSKQSTGTGALPAVLDNKE